MSVKTITGLCLVISIASTLAWGAIFASTPSRSAPRATRKLHAQRIVGATAVGLVALVGAGVGSVLILRSAREEYRVASRRNMESLVTGLHTDKTERPRPVSSDEV